MVRTTPLSSGNVRAPVCDQFALGKPRRILITRVAPEETTPLFVREALAGLKVRAMFDREQLGFLSPGFFELIPEGALVAYIGDVAEALHKAGRKEAADALLIAAEQERLAFYVFEAGTFTLQGK